MGLFSTFCSEAPLAAAGAASRWTAYHHPDLAWLLPNSAVTPPLLACHVASGAGSRDHGGIIARRAQQAASKGRAVDDPRRQDAQGAKGGRGFVREARAVNDLAPPIAGMKVVPFGLPLMLDAWLGLLYFAIGEREVRARFKCETGYDLDSLAMVAGIDRLVDQATGRDREIIVAFCDWVTVNMWGDGTDPHEITVVHPCQCAEGGFDHEFDIVVRLVRTVDVGDTFCHVQKDRLRRLPKLIEMPANNPFVLAETLATVYEDLWRLGTASNPRASDEQIQHVYELQAQLGVNGKQMALVLRESSERTNLPIFDPSRPMP